MDSKELLHSIDSLKQWIIHSEMQGNLDVADSFYPAYGQLDILREKIEEQSDYEESCKNNL